MKTKEETITANIGEESLSILIELAEKNGMPPSILARQLLRFVISEMHKGKIKLAID